MRIVMFLTLIYLISCSNLHKNSERRFNITSIPKVPLGMQKEQFQKEFGEDYKFSGYIDKRGKRHEILIFHKIIKGKERPFVRFHFKDKVLVSKTMEIYSDEKEGSWVFLKGKLGNDFVEVQEPWCNPHAGPDSIYYINSKSGIRVDYSMARESVSSVTWVDPIKSKKYLTKKYLTECSQPESVKFIEEK